MMLVGALGATFLFREKSKQKRVFEERVKGQAPEFIGGVVQEAEAENKSERSAGH